MFKKNDPLVEVSKKIMQENETRRQVVLLVNESLGIEDKKVLPRELFAEYDTILAEAQSVALKEGIDNIQLDEISKELNVRYRNAAMDSKVKHKKARDKLWNKSDRYEREAQKAYSKGDTEGMLKLDAKRQKAAAEGNDHNRKYKNREKGQQRALDRYKGYFLTKKSYGSVNEEQLDEVTIKAIVKKVANELPSRKKKIEDLNRRAMNKPTIKGWANAQKRVNAAVNEEQLDESVRTPLPKVYKKKAIKEDTSIEAINEEIYDNLLANLIEAYQSSEDAFNDMVDSLTEEQLQILGFTEGIQ